MKPVASADGGLGAAFSAAGAAAVEACLDGVGAIFIDFSASNCSSRWIRTLFVPFLMAYEVPRPYTKL